MPVIATSFFDRISSRASPKTRAESLTSQAARGCVLMSKAVRRRQHALVLCRAQSLGAAIKLTDMREITHYVWVHPGEERCAATGSTGSALIVARRCSNTARVFLRLSRRAANVMASKGYVTSERSNTRRAFRLSGPVLTELHLRIYFASSFCKPIIERPDLLQYLSLAAVVSRPRSPLHYNCAPRRGIWILHPSTNLYGRAGVVNPPSSVIAADHPIVN